MKETKIAKENVEDLKKSLLNEDIYREHKQTCQRWLEFLQLFIACESNCPDTFKSEIKPKIKDLKQAIKIYEDAGI